MTSASPPMQAAQATGPAVPPAPGNVGFGHLLLAEWTKIRSVRSTVWSLILLVIITLGFTGLFTWLTILQWSKTDPGQHDPRLRARVRAAGRLCSWRPGAHERVLHRGDQGLAACGAAAVPHAGRQGSGIHGAVARCWRVRELSLVLHRPGHPAQPRTGCAGRSGGGARCLWCRALPRCAGPVR